MTTHVQQTLPFPWQGGRQCRLQLLIQPWICAPLWQGGPRQCGIRSLPDTSTYGQNWESNPRPSASPRYPLSVYQGEFSDAEVVVDDTGEVGADRAVTRWGNAASYSLPPQRPQRVLCLIKFFLLADLFGGIGGVA